MDHNFETKGGDLKGLITPEPNFCCVPQTPPVRHHPTAMITSVAQIPPLQFIRGEAATHLPRSRFGL